ncbi:PPE family protein, SVP subgroup [Mycobacterium botniense]|uniref:PE family protein n=1 Tax=Mycobacterium botniense TaxID=84962 RepID=A0A7I9XYU4_9MYCO|nr:PE domain-containing protein [Mycobacterium botniense]GFG74910.1 PE family protein [Mycobacterium botniense]
MPFVTVHSAALAAAASKLAGIGSAVTAQNAAAAAPTTAVVPAAADQVSVLQAALFSAYGQLYQQISAQATAIHEMLVHTLGVSAASYETTEAANSAAAGSGLSGLGGILGGLTGSGSPSSAISAAWSAFTGFLGNTGPLGPSGAMTSVVMSEMGNFASAYSDVIALGGGGLLTALAGESEEIGGVAGATGLDGTLLAGAVGPAASAGSGGPGAMPVLAGVGQASAIGGLSVPPSWAAEAVPAPSPAPATLVGAGWTTAAPHAAPVATMPTSMPSVPSAGRGGLGFGTPRYGVKPTVMPKPAVV